MSKAEVKISTPSRWHHLFHWIFSVVSATAAHRQLRLQGKSLVILEAMSSGLYWKLASRSTQWYHTFERMMMHQLLKQQSHEKGQLSPVYHMDGCMGRALSCPLQIHSMQISSLPKGTTGCIAPSMGTCGYGLCQCKTACSIAELPCLQGGRETCDDIKAPATLSLTAWKSSAYSGPRAPIFLGEVLTDTHT